MSSVLRLVNVWKFYGYGDKRMAVLKNINFKVEAGELVVVMGPSGSGKSTLLSIASTLDKPSMGSVYIGDVNVTELNEEELTALRSRKLGFVFQTYNLIRNFTALENVMAPMILSGLYAVDEARSRALELLSLVGLREHYNKFPSQLSGGQQQRVAIARALANDPEIVFMDEPTGNLDTRSSAKVISLVKWLNEVYGQTFLIVTHNLELTEIATRVVYIRDGILYENPPRDLLSSKLSEELTRIRKSDLMKNAQLNLLKTRAQSLRRLMIEGILPRNEAEKEVVRIKQAIRRLQKTA